MEPKLSLSNARLKARLTLAAVLLLVAGLTSASLIYAFADEAPPDAIGYIVVDGIKYPIEPDQSKRYVRELERFGGKASVVFDEFDRWFAGLWRGKTLGITIGCLATMVSVVLFLLASSLPLDPD